MVDIKDMLHGYKETELGYFPTDWDLKPLGEVCQIFGRIGFRGYTVNDIVKESYGAISISPSNIIDNKIDFKKCTYISWFKYEESPEIKIFNGDILLVKTGSTFGKTAIVNYLPIKATINPQLIVFKKIKIDNYFMSYMLAFKVIQRQITAAIVGGAIPTLSQELVSNFKIPIPPTKAEQTAIAKVLNDTNNLLIQLEKLIDKKRNIKQGAMQDLLQPKDGYNLTNFGNLFNINPSRPQFNKEDLVVFLGMEDISTKGKVLYQHIVPFSQIKKGLTYFNKTDVLVAKITPCFENGKGACLDDLETNHGFGSTEFHVLSINEKSTSKFVYYHTQTKRFRKQLESEMIGTAGQKRVPSSSIINYTISLPDLSEQKRIAQILSDMDFEIDAIEKKVEKCKMIKQGMMEYLMTGKIRLL